MCCEDVYLVKPEQLWLEFFYWYGGGGLNASPNQNHNCQFDKYIVWLATTWLDRVFYSLR